MKFNASTLQTFGECCHQTEKDKQKLRLIWKEAELLPGRTHPGVWIHAVARTKLPSVRFSCFLCWRQRLIHQANKGNEEICPAPYSFKAHCVCLSVTRFGLRRVGWSGTSSRCTRLFADVSGGLCRLRPPATFWQHSGLDRFSDSFTTSKTKHGDRSMPALNYDAHARSLCHAVSPRFHFD